MGWIENKIDRFCIKHPRFGIPNLMLYISIGHVAVALLDQFSSSPLSAALFFYRPLIFQGEIWRLVTFIFVPLWGDFGFLGFSIPNTSLFVTAIEAYFFYWLGSMLERKWGTARFNFFFFSGMLLNILFGLIIGVTTIHYINLTMVFAAAVLFPDAMILFMLFIPMKLKWLAWIDAALFAWQIFNYLRIGLWMWALLPFVAIFNFFLFFWSEAIEAFGFRKQRFQHQHSAQTINFKKATRSPSKAYQEKGYIHKCAICGKTDTDHPEMEFRYCSKCNGYYCYCSEHINNHTHFL